MMIVVMVVMTMMVMVCAGDGDDDDGDDDGGDDGTRTMTCADIGGVRARIVPERNLAVGRFLEQGGNDSLNAENKTDPVEADGPQWCLYPRHSFSLL